MAARPRDWSPLERAIPPHTTPTRPPIGNMISPRPARTRPATAHGRPGLVLTSATGRLQLGPNLVKVGLAVALEVIGRLQQLHRLGLCPAVDLIKQVLELVAGVQSGRDQLVGQGVAHREAGLLGQVGLVGDIVDGAGGEPAAELLDQLLEPGRGRLRGERQQLRLTAHRLVMVPAPDVQRRVERPNLELHARSIRCVRERTQGGIRWPMTPAAREIASPTRGGRGRPMPPARPGRSGSTSRSRRPRSSAGSRRPACSAPTAAGWTSPWPAAASSGSGAGPAIASTTAASAPRGCTAGRPTPPPTGCCARWSARAASWSRPAGTRP